MQVEITRLMEEARATEDYNKQYQEQMRKAAEEDDTKEHTVKSVTQMHETLVHDMKRVYMCMYACLHVLMYVCTCVCMYVCTYVCMYVCMYVCIYVCIYVGVYICMYMYVYMYVCM